MAGHRFAAAEETSLKVETCHLSIKDFWEDVEATEQLPRILLELPLQDLPKQVGKQALLARRLQS